jgi:hypothetical protein
MYEFESSEVSHPVLHFATVFNLRHRPGNPGFLPMRNLSPGSRSPNLGEELPKVSGPFRGNSRFAEVIGGDRFDHNCRPTIPEGALADRFLTHKMLLGC